MKRILIVIMIFALQTVTIMPSGAAEPFKVIGPLVLKAMFDKSTPDLLVIDSRSRGEYDTAHIPDAVSIPLSQMATTPDLNNRSKSSQLVFYCSGST